MDVVCVGSGNVATHLAMALKAAGIRLIQVWSHTFANAVKLAADLEAEAIADISEITVDADFYIISVKDDAIAAVCEAMPAVKGIVVHTSGITPAEALSRFINHGVFYPLQTFSKRRTLDFKHVPLCLEAGNTVIMDTLKAVALKLGSPAYEIDGGQRRILHLSAAFACNFVNHLYALGDLILGENGLDFDLIRPLIMETADKVSAYRPLEAQTGPAVRGDEKTMAAHLEMLKDRPELAQIYQMLSNSIKKSQG